MSIRLIAWTIAMACVGFLLVGRGSVEPLSVTSSGAIMGAGIGLLLALMFSRREKRKHQTSLNTLSRYRRQ
jgi:membrane associated rhomboid family serine protease